MFIKISRNKYPKILFFHITKGLILGIVLTSIISYFWHQKAISKIEKTYKTELATLKQDYYSWVPAKPIENDSDPVVFDSEVNGWKDVVDAKMRVRFRFPKDLVFTKELGKPTYLSVRNEANRESAELFEFLIGITDRNLPVSFNFGDYIAKEQEAIENKNKCWEETDVEFVKAIFAGKPAYVYQLNNCNNSDAVVYKVQNNNSVYYIRISATGKNTESNLKMAEAILNTVQFLD